MVIPPQTLLERIRTMEISPSMLPQAVTSIWGEEAKFGLWLDVEVNLVIAWTSLYPDQVPRADALTLANRAQFDLTDIAHYELETHHDVTAFIRSVSDSLGSEARWFHYGVTSSDIVDTALAVLMAGTIGLCKSRVEAAMVVGRTKWLSYKTLVWVRNQLYKLEDEVAVGQLSGPVGTNATLPRNVEEMTCRMCGVAAMPVTTQIIPRDIHAQYVLTIARVVNMLTRVLNVGNYDHQLGWSAALARSNCVVALENVALWHERDISHSSTERIILPQASAALALVLSAALEV